MAEKKQTKPSEIAKAKVNDKAWRAKLACRPTVNSAAVTAEYASTFGEQDISALVEELTERTQSLKEGNLDGVEAMLYAQAHALQSIFVNLSRRAVKQDYLKQFGTYLGFALKAQAQCRATLETLAEVKNPKPPTFVRQQNVAYQQQVNNGDLRNKPHDVPARTEKSVNQSNELLEAQHGERLDSGTAGTAGGTDPAMATMEAIDRRENG